MPHTLICQYCGKEFEADKKTRMFCSYTCSGASKRTPDIYKLCKHCGKRFKLQKKHQGVEYCSHECFLETVRAYKICPQCGKKFFGPNDIYCSKECVTLSQTKQIDRICTVCGKHFTVSPHVLKAGNGNFCSRPCAISYQKAQRVSFICECCGKHFKVIPSQLDYRKPRFCSLDCWRKYSGESLPEIKTRKVLDRLNISYEQEYRFLTYFLDFYLPDFGVDLEVDGEYWHRNKKRHDTKRDELVTANGLRVIRITDREINEADNLDKLIKSCLLSD